MTRSAITKLAPVILLMTSYAITQLHATAQPPALTLASSTRVEAFEATATRAMEAFRKLAQNEHIVIGVSGTLVGSDHTLISVKLSHTTVEQILNAITSSDPRYTWRDTPDGAIEITIDQHAAPLLAVVVHGWTLRHALRYEITTKLANFDEINNWLRSHSCTMSEITAGAPSTEGFDIHTSASDEPLRNILNDIARQTGIYFWSAIKYSENRCTINLMP